MALDAIYNYYEPLVYQAMVKTMQNGETLDNDALDDVACVALNRLPARYLRHTVDMVFYMSVDERERIEAEVDEAVRAAFAFVKSHRHSRAAE